MGRGVGGGDLSLVSVVLVCEAVLEAAATLAAVLDDLVAISELLRLVVVGT